MKAFWTHLQCYAGKLLLLKSLQQVHNRHLSDLCVKFYFHSCCTQSLCLLLTAEEMESVCLQLIS